MNDLTDRDAIRQRLQQLLNLGPKTAEWLIDAGYESPEQIADEGAAAVWLKTREIHPELNLTGLYALQAALMDLHWLELPEEIKADLRRQVGR